MQAWHRIVPPVALALGLWLGTSASSTWAQSDWPRWRGPQGNGHSQEMRLPVRWDAGAIAWKAPLSGSGQSSPIVWRDRIFLTSALEEGRKRLVLCHDRRDGKLLWERTAWTGAAEPIHEMNSWASA